MYLKIKNMTKIHRTGVYGDLPNKERTLPAEKLAVCEELYDGIGMLLQSDATEDSGNSSVEDIYRRI